MAAIMMRSVAVALALLASACASNLALSESNFGDLPPREFMGRYAGLVHFVERDELQKICGRGEEARYQSGSSRQFTYQGCVGKLNGETVIVLPQPCEDAIRFRSQYAMTACHEIGHALGWPADHPRR